MIFGRGERAEPRPPGAGADAAVEREHAKIARAARHRLDHAAGAVMRHAGNGEAEMEARGIAHRRVAARHVDMDRIIRLNIGEGRDDDAPDALDRVERQQAAMALGERAHHRGLARRPEGRAAALARLDRDQPVDDPAALHQQFVHRRVDPVDLDAEIGKRFEGGWL